MQLELNCREIEILDHLGGYGSNLAKVIHGNCTSAIPLDELTALIQSIRGQVAPVMDTVRAARKAVNESLTKKQGG